MSKKLDTAGRSFFALSIVIMLFWLRWDFGAKHFDWQVWAASNTVFDNGANPYNPTILNEELQSDAAAYGEIFRDHQPFMYLSNPPSWLATIRFHANSAFLVALVGALAMAGSIVELTRNRPFIDTVGGLGGLFVFANLGPGTSTFAFGQAGLFLAGMVSLHIALRGKTLWGVPVALLSSKPHFAFAAGISELIRNPKRASIQMAIPYGLLVLATTVILGARSWFLWVDGLSNNALPDANLPDMSIGSLHPTLPWRDLGLTGVVIGLVLSTAFAWRYRKAAPIPVAIASLAIAIYLSGHAFMHDWLWLPIVPIALKWNPVASLIGISALGLALLPNSPIVPPGLPTHHQPIIALVVTVVLIVVAVRSQDSEDETSNQAADSELDVTVPA